MSVNSRFARQVLDETLCGEPLPQETSVQLAEAVLKMEKELAEWSGFRRCTCGQAWRPAAGLYGTTEETECPACILRKLYAGSERERNKVRLEVSRLGDEYDELDRRRVRETEKLAHEHAQAVAELNEARAQVEFIMKDIDVLERRLCEATGSADTKAALATIASAARVVEAANHAYLHISPRGIAAQKAHEALLVALRDHDAQKDSSGSGEPHNSDTTCASPGDADRDSDSGSGSGPHHPDKPEPAGGYRHRPTVPMSDLARDVLLVTLVRSQAALSLFPDLVTALERAEHEMGIRKSGSGT